MNSPLTNNEITLNRTFSNLWNSLVQKLDQSILDQFDIHNITKQNTENWDKEIWDKESWDDKAPGWKNWDKSDDYPS